MKFAIRHENGKWLRDASGYTPAWTAWMNKRQEFTGKQDAKRAHKKCEFLLHPCKIIEIKSS
jgi:hypothetical protein